MPHPTTNKLVQLILEEKEASKMADRQMRALDCQVRRAYAAGWNPTDDDLDALINGTENEREAVLSYCPRPYGDKIDTAIVHAYNHLG